MGARHTAVDEITRWYYRVYSRFDAAAIADSFLGRSLLRILGWAGSAAFAIRGYRQKPWFVRRPIHEVRDILPRTRQRSQGKVPLPPEVQTLKDLKVAMVADGFTALAYSFECRTLQLRADDWKEKIEAFKPHLLFVESAWDGKGESWKWKVSILSPEIVELVHWCKENGIPTVFWNKEDPRHFDTFIRTAALFDHVFTTDVDKIRDYRENLGTEQVYLLPFAAQPAIHNPIELFERRDAFCFAGSYYAQHYDRNATFSRFVETLASIGDVEIYDRYLNTKDERMIFPRTYDPFIKGTLPPAEIERAYKSYLYGINMNTVKTSRSMFARRVFELIGSNTIVLSNYSLGQVNMLGELTVCTDSHDELWRKVKRFRQDRSYRDRYRLAALREVMQQHTYSHRLHDVAEKVFEHVPEIGMPTITVIAAPRTREETARVREMYDAQSYEKKRLCLVASPEVASRSDADVVIDPAQGLDHRIFTIGAEHICFFDARDHYGVNYFTDLALGRWWSGAFAVGKRCYLDGSGRIVNDGQEYVFVSGLPWRSSLVDLSAIPALTFGELLRSAVDEVVLPVCLSIDRFNYCRGSTTGCPSSEDLKLEGAGVPLADLGRV